MSRIATPGVYLVEQNSFSTSVSAVPTAVPAFIGYTERALREKESLLNKPTRITSFAEYVRYFGEAPKTTFTINANAQTEFDLSVNTKTQYYLHDCLRMFYANGGGTCYIVSVGDYSKGISASDLNDEKNVGGLQTLPKEQEPTLVVIPDAVLLPAEDCYSLYQAVLSECGSSMKRFGIFDVHGGYKERTFDKNDVVTAFRGGIGNNYTSYGSAYYPWVQTTVTGANEIDFRNISNLDTLEKILIAEAKVNLGISDEPAAKPTAGDKGKKPAPPKATVIDPQTKKKLDAIIAEINKLTDANANPVSVDETLKTLSVTYKAVLKNIREKLNLLPASAAMAGLYAMVDNLVGVHKSPANISMSSVISPAVRISNENQEDLNMPISGKAVNAIREFIGKGVLVWGARTLNGNSQDWRYVNVRRTVIMLEQSIKNSIEAYVFEPNTAQTWIKAKTSIDNFLTDAWKSGALVGSTTAEAFEVVVGLGTTMTPVDVLDGIMRINVKVAVSRPAEFIIITFSQKMQES